MKPDVEKYLRKHGCDKWQMKLSSQKKYKCIVVIPAISEYENIKTLLHSISKCDSKYSEEILIVFVINNSAEVDNGKREDNAKSLSLLNNIVFEKDKLGNEFSENLNSFNFGYVDCSSEGNELPLRDAGVGLARKIGMDLSLHHFNYSDPKKNMLICLDADCEISENYFTSIITESNENDISAGYVNFEHPYVDNEEINKAILSYEIFLRYYVLSLTYSNSPYAFHTIGSTIVCDAESYIQAGGMNKRKAAEDFYFIEKLAKNNSIIKIDEAYVYPSPRTSWRVPFGTGQRVGRYLAQTHNEYELYSPKSFQILREWNELFFENDYSVEELLKRSKDIKEHLHNFLNENNFAEAWNKVLTNTKSQEQINKQKIFWFDGFRNLKLIHYLRDNCFPNENMFEAVLIMFELMQIEHDVIITTEFPSLDIQKKILNILRKVA